MSQNKNQLGSQNRNAGQNIFNGVNTNQFISMNMNSQNGVNQINQINQLNNRQNVNQISNNNRINNNVIASKNNGQDLNNDNYNNNQNTINERNGNNNYNNNTMNKQEQQQNSNPNDKIKSSEEISFQLQVATVNCGTCNKTSTISNSMVKSDGQSGQYYGQQKCQSCQQTNYFFWCECNQYIISKDKMYDGCLHECTNTKCRKKQQIVKCPHCYGYNLFYNSEYIMGAPTTCHSCSSIFQQVACQRCKEDTYFEGNYKEGTPFICTNKDCSAHSQNVQHLNCPQCSYPNLINIIHPLQNHSCQNCQTKFMYIPCKKCQSCILVEGDILPELGKRYECKNCNSRTSLTKCMFCKTFSLIESNKTGDYGKITCPQQNCQKKYYLLKCEKGSCKTINEVEDKDGKEVLDLDCQGCKKKSFFMACPQCGSGYSLTQTDLSGSKTVDCQKCSAKVNHNINYNIQSASLECKICFEKQALFLIDTCNHLFGCQDCADGLKATYHSERVKCPICRSQGQVKKIFF